MPRRNSAFMANCAAAAAASIYQLTGTVGVPIISSVSKISPTNALAGWYFESATRDIDREQFAGRSYYADWASAVPPDLWIRATNVAGDNPTGGSGLGTWLPLVGAGSAERFWTWLETTNGFATTSGTVMVELSTDSGGVTIVSTGYYRGVASVEL
jgi:hypothetical protein